VPSAATFRAPITDLTRLLVIAVPMPPEPPHALGPSQDRSAKAAATAATAAIKACESATAACAAGQPSTLEPVSGQAGLRFPGKVILGDRDRAAITSVEAEREKSRDQVDPTEGADTGYLAPPQEISAVRRVIGGAMRTRTSDPLSGHCKARRNYNGISMRLCRDRIIGISARPGLMQKSGSKKVNGLFRPPRGSPRIGTRSAALPDR
jgi:hypothetical protein